RGGANRQLTEAARFGAMSVSRTRGVTAETVLLDLGVVYGVDAPVPVRKHPTKGPGRGGGWGHTSNVRLTFEVGRRGEPVEVGTSVAQTDESQIVNLLLFSAVRPGRTPRLPLTLTIEHKRIELPVDGQRQAFETYTCGRTARSLAIVGGKEITVGGSTGLL